MDELISAPTLFTLGGASFAVTLVGNVAKYIFDWNQKWLGLIVAMGLGIGSTLLIKDRVLTDWLVSIFRGLQIYATSVGIAGMASNPKNVNQNNRDLTPQPKKFWQRWF